MGIVRAYKMLEPLVQGERLLRRHHHRRSNKEGI